MPQGAINLTPGRSPSSWWTPGENDGTGEWVLLSSVEVSGTVKAIVGDQANPANKRAWTIDIDEVTP